MTTMEFKYKIGQPVVIDDKICRIDGRIRAIWITDCGVQYKASYFSGGKQEEAYFYEDELESGR